jgi:CRP-like cAMP-binding protein|tara:strand:- start:5990 stop:6565 length:576 start_codon:yes stop_codon:yes gene_type:complete
MKDQLEHFIRLNVKNPNDEEIKAILEIFHLKHFQKGEYFKQSNNLSTEIGFIIEGGVRHYIVKNNGNEVTGRILQKNNFTIDIISSRTKEKTLISIIAMEPTILLVASIENMNKLFEVNLTLNRLIREYILDKLVDLGKLSILFLAGTGKERYDFILENNPALLKKTPLRFIASMIGITATQLSRIRKNRK